jgi:Fe-S-cluster containining protein
MEADKNNVGALAQKKGDENRAFFKKLKKKPPRNLDEVVHELHDRVFSEFDCLTCANCCSSISPIVTDKDIERLARHLKIKPAQLIEQYLHLDEDQDYVFNDTPCPFLMADNYCMVYQYRPKACREYPHTDRRRFAQILQLTLKNCEVCPIVYEVVERLKQQNL